MKYRHASDSGTVDLGGFDGDFLAVVRGNQGYRYRKRSTPDDTGYGDRELWIIPMPLAQQLATRSNDGKRWRIRCADLPAEYLGRFDQILVALGGEC